MSKNKSNFLLYLVILYNSSKGTEDVYVNDSNVIGVGYNKNIISQFEKFDFYEKLDVFSEIFIEYDNAFWWWFKWFWYS